MNIDQVMEKAKQAMNLATQQTEKMLNISKLKLELSKVTGEKNKKYEKIGRLSYQMNKEGSNNQGLLQSLYENIEDLKQRETAIQQAISKFRNTIICAVCLHQNIQSNLFCCHCGSKLEQDQTAEPTSSEPLPTSIDASIS